MGGLGSGGRNRRTAAEHALRNTLRPDRHAKVVDLRERRTQPPAPAPRAPDGLSPASLSLWDRVMAQYEGFGAHEILMLELALRAADRAEVCRARLTREGLVRRGKRGGNLRPHPLLRVQRDAETFVAATFKQLRLGR